ncbi:MAG TPA: hypothetical protein VMA73_08405 [Streptosporangiaceae bacterium]|nr:hypothetical protein [Streptosporangiaceae bacterium]
MIFGIADRREAEEELRESLPQLAIADDRQLIACDLHDGVAGALAGLGTILRALSVAVDGLLPAGDALTVLSASG